jgi:Transposase DDE domain
MEVPPFLITKGASMETIAQVSTAMQTVLTTLAAEADVELRYTKRPDLAKFSASTLVQTLVFGWLAHPDATVEQLAQMAATVGVEVSPQAIDQRFTVATAALLRTVLLGSVQQVIASDPVAIPILQRFTGVRVHDSTTIVLPDVLADHAQGCGGQTATNTAAALKCGLQLDLLTGAYTHLDLADGRAADQRLPLNHAPLPPGTLRLADLGFLDLGGLATLAAAGAYFLSKLSASMTLSDGSQSPVALPSFMRNLGPCAQWEGDVWVGQEHALPARLLVQAVPQEVADQRRRRIRAEARRKGRTPSAAALALAAWTIFITNVPVELLSLPEALVLAKVRWQIELIFKLWKSYGLVDQWRTGKPARILCELYAKLLGMVLQQWCFIVGCWTYPDRSLVKAAQVVRDHAVALAHARGCPARLADALRTIQQVLRRTARMHARSTHPNTYQLLLALTTEDADPASPIAAPSPTVVDSPVRLPAQRALRRAA